MLLPITQRLFNDAGTICVRVVSCCFLQTVHAYFFDRKLRWIHMLAIKIHSILSAMHDCMQMFKDTKTQHNSPKKETNQEGAWSHHCADYL